MKRPQEHRHNLTCEKLGKRFNNMFDLVKYAKRVAEGMVYSGRQPEKENIANRILEDIASHREVILSAEAIAEKRLKAERQPKSSNRQPIETFEEEPETSKV